MAPGRDERNSPPGWMGGRQRRSGRQPHSLPPSDGAHGAMRPWLAVAAATTGAALAWAAGEKARTVIRINAANFFTDAPIPREGDRFVGFEWMQSFRPTGPVSALFAGTKVRCTMLPTAARAGRCAPARAGRRGRPTERTNAWHGSRSPAAAASSDGRSSTTCTSTAGTSSPSTGSRRRATDVASSIVDLTDYGQAVEALGGIDDRHDGVDALVHLAAIPAPGLRANAATFANNITASYNVYSAALARRRAQDRVGLERDRARPAVRRAAARTSRSTRSTRRARTARTRWSRRSRRNWPASCAGGIPTCR